jgi:hypothetical protein
VIPGPLRRLAAVAALAFVIGGAGVPPPVDHVLVVDASATATPFKCVLHALIGQRTATGAVIAVGPGSAVGVTIARS